MAWETVGVVAADAAREERVAFIRRTYAHLLGAVLAFIGIEAFLFQTGAAGLIMRSLPPGRLGWLVVLGGFMFVGWLAQRWTQERGEPSTQYLGLGIYVIAESLIFVPLLSYAARFAGPDTIPAAGVYTALIFTGLTGTVFLTKKDFSFLQPALAIAGFAALGVIVTSMLFGFNLGNLFCAAMVVFASGYILFYTSKVLNGYPTDAHVAASLALFSAVALLFWYVLRILASSRR
ncbi:MAG TPA: Bax inhibitor-1 family protein [Myxococcales bacterium]|nr:Bax inhibitor-1 family protein [Myxococcales bacterium]